jgi:tRNA dimethylallyltransferase
LKEEKSRNQKITDPTVKKNYLVVIAGPTAVGKTKAAIEIARHYNTEIISADSRQFYKELSIGTARPSEEELSLVPHHFIASHSITENYSASDFEKDAVLLLEKLFAKNNVIVMAGGSGMYIDAVCKGMDDLPAADPVIRSHIAERLKDGGIASLQEWLLELDPEYHAIVDLNNPQRLSRAIEVCLASGTTYTSLRKGSGKARNFSCIHIGLTMDRSDIYKRIDERVKVMRKSGLLKEAKAVVAYRAHNALQTVGYRELFDHFDGKINEDEAFAQIAQHTRNFAKRQLTWFRRNNEMTWFHPSDTTGMISHIDLKISR